MNKLLVSHNDEHSLNYNYKRGCRCDACLGNHKTYYVCNRRKYLDSAKLRHIENREKDNLYRKKWYDKNADSIAKEWKTYYATHKDEYRRKFLKRLYGITPEKYDYMFRQQNGLCLICQKTSTMKLSVDHDKTTKAVRGLLCNPCNLGIGSLRHDPKNAERAVQYLRGELSESFIPRF
jgi:hypothetical protein